MLGKIVELRGIPLENGFEAVYGIAVPWTGRKDIGFAQIELTTNRFNTIQEITYIYDYEVTKQHDGFKNILVRNLKPKKEDSEEYLFVIIRYSQVIETTATKIAGRYPCEAILKMHVGDTVKVNKACSDSETYMAVQAGNEMFLVKKNR